MIAYDRRSQIAESSAIVCDRLRSCDRNRRRSQKIEPCSISTKYNMSDRIVSDIQCRAEGETFYIRYNTDANHVLMSIVLMK